MKSNKLSIILIGTSVLLLCATLVGFFNVFMPAKKDSVKTDDITFETETSISDVMASLTKVTDIGGASFYCNPDLTCIALKGGITAYSLSVDLGVTLFKAGTYSCEIFTSGFANAFDPALSSYDINYFGLAYYDIATGTTGDPIWFTRTNNEFTLTEDTYLCMYFEHQIPGPPEGIGIGTEYLAEDSDVAIIRLYWNHTPLETVTETVAETESVKETVSA